MSNSRANRPTNRSSSVIRVWAGSRSLSCSNSFAVCSRSRFRHANSSDSLIPCVRHISSDVWASFNNLNTCSTLNWGEIGFTLIELIVVIAIVAILAVVAVPSFINLIKNNRLNSQASDFMTSLMLARSEAIRRGASICVKSNGSNGSWTEGWKIALDATTDCSSTTASILQSYELLLGGNTLTVGDPFKTYIRYNSLGVAINSNGTPAGSADFKICRGTTTNDIANSRVITISATGHPAIKVDSTTSSPISPITCP